PCRLMCGLAVEGVAFDVARDAIATIGAPTQSGESIAVAKAPRSFRSWGEVLVVIKRDREPRIVVVSRSRQGTLIDWGKNRDNVHLIGTYLADHGGYAVVLSRSQALPYWGEIEALTLRPESV